MRWNCERLKSTCDFGEFRRARNFDESQSFQNSFSLNISFAPLLHLRHHADALASNSLLSTKLRKFQRHEFHFLNCHPTIIAQWCTLLLLDCYYEYKYVTTTMLLLVTSLYMFYEYFFHQNLTDEYICIIGCMAISECRKR